jgi:folate-binding protein YgfZ
MPGNPLRFEILGPVTSVSDLWKRLADGGAVPANTDRWNLLDIRAGIPTVYAATVEAFVPQMTNMQLVEGVSFTKGCYTGQEVVARMQYLGKLKRRMYRAEVATDRCPHPGDELFSGASESGQGTGKVVAAAPIGDGRCELLAVVEISAVEQGNVRLGEAGPELEFRELPYAFPEPQAASS